jgi:signal transduction histidine kinase
MTTTISRALDTPATPDASLRGGRRYGRLWADVPGSLLFLLPNLPIAIAGSVLAVTILSLGFGLAILGIGIVIGVGGLWVSRAWVHLEIVRLRTTGLRPIRMGSWRSSIDPTTTIGAVLAPLAGPRWWLAALHTVIVNPIICGITWGLTITWTVGAVAGCTAWIWVDLLPAGSSSGLAELLSPALDPADAALADKLVNLGIGIVFLATLPPVLRGLVLLHHAVASAMFGTRPQEELRAALVAEQRARGAAVSAEAGAVRRLERDIHDGPQQRLVRLQMDLAAAERRLDTDPESARILLGEARAQAAETLDELRALSKGLMPPLLQDRGLVAALEDLAARSAVPTRTELSVIASLQLPRETERGLYFVVAELLTNVSKHAAARAARVEAATTLAPQLGARLILRVVDDGRGGAHVEPGHGLEGLVERAQGLGGALTIERTPVWDGVARGSSVSVSLPVG